MRFDAAARAERAARRAERTRPVEIGPSRFKYGLLSFCALLVAGAAGAELLGFVAAEHSRGTTFAMLAIGLAVAAVLAWMGFDSRPVLTIDQHGITCRRPNTGLIPWEAVAGLGLGRAVLVRTVLMVGLDGDADPQLLERLRRHGSSASSVFSAQVSRFKGQMRNRMVIEIPIAFLAIGRDELQRLLEERVRFDGG